MEMQFCDFKGQKDYEVLDDGLLKHCYYRIFCKYVPN